MMMFRKASEANALSLFDELQSDIYTALESEGERVAAELKDVLSVPVEYRIGPRGGTYVIRSKPGEAPRRETGRLQDSIESRVETDAGSIEMTVDTDVPYAPYLEPPAWLNRPHFITVFEDNVDLVIDAVLAAVQGA